MTKKPKNWTDVEKLNIGIRVTSKGVCFHIIFRCVWCNIILFVTTESLKNELELDRDRTPKSYESRDKHNILVILEIWS